MVVKTSWSKVAGWYDELLSGDDTYQKEVILPNLLRLLELQKSERVLDLACGQGFFAREFSKAGAKVTGVDISAELIALAEKQSEKTIHYYIGKADELDFLPAGQFTKATIVLAMQNIENVNGVLGELKRVLMPKGKLFLVLNHPAFRIPKHSDWSYDEEENIQYRRLAEYLSESRTNIDMHPGEEKRDYTVSFHRPLQFYFKALAKNGFSVARLEEWNSHKKSEKGPRQVAEDKARKEIPLFLLLEVVKNV